MIQATDDGPSGTPRIAGVVHRRSPHTVPETVGRLTEAIEGVGAKLFAVVDHSGEAALAGISLRDTKLVIFGSPAAGTLVMQTRPLAALDLPLKVLVWADDAEGVWMTYLSEDWLADRHEIPPDIAKPLGAVDGLTSRVATFP